MKALFNNKNNYYVHILQVADTGTVFLTSCTSCTFELHVEGVGDQIGN